MLPTEKLPNPSASEKDRRLSPRLRAEDVPWIREIKPNNGDSARLLNISRTGVLLETTARLQPGRRSTIIIVNEADQKERAEGQVIRTELVAIGKSGELIYRTAMAFTTELDLRAPGRDTAAAADACVQSQLEGPLHATVGNLVRVTPGPDHPCDNHWLLRPRTRSRCGRRMGVGRRVLLSSSLADPAGAGRSRRARPRMPAPVPATRAGHATRPARRDPSKGSRTAPPRHRSRWGSSSWSRRIWRRASPSSGALAPARCTRTSGKRTTIPISRTGSVLRRSVLIRRSANVIDSRRASEISWPRLENIGETVRSTALY